MLNDTPKNIVFISYLGIGDNLMALSALRDFKYDDNSIRWICKSDSAPLIKNVFPHSSSFIIEKKNKSRILVNIRYYLIMCCQIVSFLKKTECKKAIILDYKKLPVTLFALLCRIAGVHKIYSCYDKPVRNMFLTKTYNMSRYKNTHEVERYRELFTLVLGTAEGKSTIALSLPSCEVVFRMLNRKASGSPKVAIAPGSERTFKRWRIENWIELALRLTKQGKQVFILGGSDDKVISEAIMKQLPYGSAHNFAGYTDLIQTAALMKDVELCITNDTALMHLADFLGVNVVGLFGVTRPQRCGPYNQPNNVITAAGPESGTYYYGKFNKWDDSCINTITVDTVWNKVQELSHK